VLSHQDYGFYLIKGFMLSSITQRLANDLSARPAQVIAAVQLLDDGATVPFIARYRKEVTDGLDDGQLRLLEQRLSYLRELEARRDTILDSIESQGKLTDPLKKAIQTADTKTSLEDLYLPYKPKRRTKAQIAREAGLNELAQQLWQQPETDPEKTADTYINADKGVADSKAALEGARHILMEQFAEDAVLLADLRSYLWDQCVVSSKVVETKIAEGQKFADYFDYQEAINKIPSHRALALFRGRNEHILQVSLLTPDDIAENKGMSYSELAIAKRFNINNQQRAADSWLQTVVRWTWRVKLRGHLEVELLLRLREAAEQGAIQVFADNLKDLLLAAPAGEIATIGLDPGLRTGVKVAVLDHTGKLLEHGAIFPHAPKNQWDNSIQVLAVLAKQHNIKLMSIGNGTASRETERLVSDLIKQQPELRLQKLVVSEAGASVYSASELAAQEFPDLDVTIRGAVSIARRLQDPLAELVKIEAKAIGVGQYQHDVNQIQLAQSLGAVVEDCVNAVGVDLNTASAPLLAKVSGLNRNLAQNIIVYRDQHGAFKNRKSLLKVSRLGAKAFEQAAGFLRIRGADNPLDGSAVHPEAYPVVEAIVKKTGKSVPQLLNNGALLKRLKAQDYANEQFGLPTVKDIISELDKPGRDPRPSFKTASFKDGIETMHDLQPDMVLEGVVTNVTNFGAFVDVGVHQDGLVHISALADRYVSDPREVVKAGQVVKVKVLEVDVKRKRIALTMKLNADSREYEAPTTRAPASRQQQKKQDAEPAGSMADAFARAQGR